MRGRVFLVIALVIVSGCGSDGAPGTVPPATTISGTSEGSHSTEPTVVEPSPSPPDPTGAPAAGALPDPCAVVSPAEIEAFIEPGTKGIESEFSTELMRECDWFDLDRGLAIQVQATPSLDSLSDWGDIVEEVPGHAREVKVVYLDGDDTVVAVGVDAGDRAILLYTVQRIQKDSAELEDLISLGLLAADRVAS